jgi:large subunit ribosomal protein L15
MVIKIKKRKKAKKLHGQNTYGWGSRKKHKGSGHRGGIGMAGTGKRADHKKTLINKLYGNKYFGKQGITSKGTERKKLKTINLREISQKFAGKKELDLKKYKILGDGEITNAITIKAKAFTKSAKEKIEKAGGKIIVPVIKIKETPKVVSSKKDNEKKDSNKEVKEDIKKKKNE